MNPRITRQAHWDGSFTMILDGEPISGRLPLSALEPLEQYVDALLRVKGLEPIKVSMEGPHEAVVEWRENS